MKIREFFERYVFTRQCAGCGELLSYAYVRESFCPKCRIIWDRAKTENCPTCFQAISECTCMPKNLASTGAVSLRKLTRYSSSRQQEPQNRLLYFIKHTPNRRHMTFLASELLPAIREELAKAGVKDEGQEAVIIHLPRGKWAKNKYGFDQSEWFCHALSEQIGIPHAKNAIGRRLGGTEQKKLDRKERQENIRGLLFIKEPEAVRDKVVILFDDIVTTGASMAACASLLKKAGAKTLLLACISQN